MKLLTFYSDTHKELYEKYFLSSYNKHLSEDFELIAKHITQISKSGDYGSNGFLETMLEKVKHIIDNIDLSSNDPLVFSDCDIQFFDNFKENIIGELGDFDIKFQNDVSCRCAGFFICKQNNIVMDFFKEVYDETIRCGEHDQVAVNNLLMNNKFPDLKHGILSNRYFTVPMTNGTRRWDGEEFDVPNDILIHHGNWTVGISNKMKIMEYVKNKREGGSK